MSDRFKNLGMSLSSPAVNAAEIIPDDATDLPATTRALWIGAAGDIAVRMAGGDQVTLTGVSGLLPIRVDRVLATGTSAGAVVALW